MSRWIEEIYKEGLSFRLARRDLIYSEQSQFQKVEVFESTHHGRVLLIDGCFMLSERDEAVYHEMMAHVPSQVHPRLEKVLIIGGGDGGTAREILRHQSVQRVTLVDIDELVVKASKAHFPNLRPVFDDPRLRVVIEDGVKWVRRSFSSGAAADGPYDLVLIDSTDPQGAATPLFGSEFYADVNQCLKADGVLVAQGESAFYEAEMQKTLLKIVAPLFRFVSPFNFTNMTYPGGLWSFIWASKSYHPLHDRRDRLPYLNECLYYTEQVHHAAFSLPQFQRRNLGQWIKL